MINHPISDTSRAIQHDPSMDWPESVQIKLCWRDKRTGRAKISTIEIKADQFFGRGAYGAPMNGEALIQTIERLRRAGPPKPARKSMRQQGD